MDTIMNVVTISSMYAPEPSVYILKSDEELLKLQAALFEFNNSASESDMFHIDTFQSEGNITANEILKDLGV